MARAVELLFVLAPGNSAAQVCAVPGNRQQTAIVQPGNVEMPLLNDAYCAISELFWPPGNYLGAKASRTGARLQVINHGCARLPEQCHQRSGPGDADELTAVDSVRLILTHWLLRLQPSVYRLSNGL